MGAARQLNKHIRLTILSSSAIVINLLRMINVGNAVQSMEQTLVNVSAMEETAMYILFFERLNFISFCFRSIMLIPLTIVHHPYLEVIIS